MQFPVTIWFHSLGWTAKLSLTDWAGATVGYSPLIFGEDRCLPVYADQDMARQTYAVRWLGPARNDVALLDAEGTPIGGVALPKPQGWGSDGTYVVSVGGEERFDIVERSPGLHLVDGFIDTVPVANVLTGLMLQPCHVFRRRAGGEQVAIMVKHRTMFDASYRLELTGAVDDRDGECIMLAGTMVAIGVRRLVASWP